MPTDSPRSLDLARAEFEKLLARRELKPGEFLPSERRLAQQWNISRIAVNRAAFGLISAGRLRREGQKLVVLVSPGSIAPTLHVAMLAHRLDRIPQELRRQAAKEGVVLKMLSYWGREDVHRLLDSCVREGFDGVLFLRPDGPWEWARELSLLRAHGIPVVACAEAPPGENMVAPDYFAGAFALVQEFVRLGHRNLVVIGSSGRVQQSERVLAGFAAGCMVAGIPDSANQVVSLFLEKQSTATAVMVEIRERFPRATALLLSEAMSFSGIAAALAERGLRVPADISLATIEETAEIRRHQPGITSASFEPAHWRRLALDIVINLIRQWRTYGAGPHPVRVHIEPEIRRRGSIAVIGIEHTRITPQLALASVSPWPAQAEERRARARQSWLKNYAATHQVEAMRFVSLDLRPFANQPRQRLYGFLGDAPLLHFPAGRKLIHGVPFEVMNHRHNRGCDVVVLRSAQDTTVVKRRLPDTIQLPVEGRAMVIYWLHACGWAALPETFAWYIIEYEDGQTHDLPISCASNTEPSEISHANIQDWWPILAQHDWPHARHLVVTANGDPLNYERYLYTLEWINPRPHVAIREIRVRSDIRRDAKLAVLAVTLLRPPGQAPGRTAPRTSA